MRSIIYAKRNFKSVSYAFDFDDSVFSSWFDASVSNGWLDSGAA